MSVVNLTPHAVTVLDADGGLLHEYPPSGDIARLGTIELGTQHYPDVDTAVELVEFGHLVKSPPKLAGTWYIVSLPCALAYPRADFLVPYLEVRDDAGRIIGCRLLARSV